MVNNTKAWSLLVTALIASCTIKPKPLSDAQINQKTAKDNQALAELSPAINGKTLSLNDAIARSLKFNLESRLKLFEQSVATSDWKAVSLNMLPELQGRYGYVDRSNQNQVISPTTGNVSTAEDQQRRLKDLTLSWNFLDLGISYFMSQQKADEILIAVQQRRKMTQQLAKETRFNFWNAYALQKYYYDSRNLRQEIRSAIHQTNSAQDANVMAVDKAASYRRELWDMASRIKSREMRVSGAKERLMRLIQAPFSSQVRLVTSKDEHFSLPKGLPNKLSALQDIALKNRPEFQTAYYQKRIDLNEVNKAKVEMLPIIRGSYGHFYDSNSFLVNNNWLTGTLDLTWNLFAMPSKYQRLKMAEKIASMADFRRLALAMAITSQVSIAKENVDLAKDSLYYRQKILKNDKELYHFYLNKQQSSLDTELTVTEAHAQYIESKLSYDIAYAEYHIACAMLLESLGYDPIEALENLHLPIDKLSGEIKRLSMKWQNTFNLEKPTLNRKQGKDGAILAKKDTKKQVIVAKSSKNSQKIARNNPLLPKPIITAKTNVALPVVSKSVIKKTVQMAANKRKSQKVATPLNKQISPVKPNVARASNTKPVKIVAKNNKPATKKALTTHIVNSLAKANKKVATSNKLAKKTDVLHLASLKSSLQKLKANLKTPKKATTKNEPLMQVATFSNPNNAFHFQQELANALKVPVIVKPYKKWHVVYAGPFEKSKERTKIKESIAKFMNSPRKGNSKTLHA